MSARECNEITTANMPKIHYTSFPVASPQQDRNINDRSVTSWRKQTSVVSVVSCRFPNSITKTCWPCRYQVRNKQVRNKSVMACPHCRRKVRLSHFCETVSLLCDTVSVLWDSLSETVSLSATVWTGLNKLAASPFTRKLRRNVCNGFWTILG